MKPLLEDVKVFLLYSNEELTAKPKQKIVTIPKNKIKIRLLTYKTVRK